MKPQELISLTPVMEPLNPLTTSSSSGCVCERDKSLFGSLLRLHLEVGAKWHINEKEEG